MFAKRSKLITVPIQDKYLKLKLQKNKIFRSTKLTNYIFEQFGQPKSYSCYVEIRKVIESEITTDGETDQETEHEDFQALVKNVSKKLNHLKGQVKKWQSNKTNTSTNATGSWQAGFGDRSANKSAADTDSEAESSEIDIESEIDKNSSNSKKKTTTKKTPTKNSSSPRKTRSSAKRNSNQNEEKKKKLTRRKKLEEDFSDDVSETEEEVPKRRKRSISGKNSLTNFLPTRRSNEPEKNQMEYFQDTPPTSQHDQESETPEVSSRAKQMTLDKFFKTRNKSNVTAEQLKTPKKSPRVAPQSAQKSPSSVIRKGMVDLSPKGKNLVSPLKIDALKKNLMNEIDEMSNSQLSEMLNSQIFEEIVHDNTAEMFSSLRDCSQPIAQSTAINNTALVAASQVSEFEQSFEMKNVVNSTPINSAGKNNRFEKTALPAITETVEKEEEGSLNDSFSQVPPTQVSPTKPRNLPKVIQSTLVTTNYIIRDQENKIEEPEVPEEEPEVPEEEPEEEEEPKVPEEEPEIPEEEPEVPEEELDEIEKEEEKMEVEVDPLGDVNSEEDLSEKEEIESDKEEEKVDMEVDPLGDVIPGDDASNTSFESAKEIIDPVHFNEGNVNDQEGEIQTENQESNDTESKYETNKSESDSESLHSNKSLTSEIGNGLVELSQYPKWKRQSDIYTDSEEESKKSDDPSMNKLQISEMTENNGNSTGSSRGRVANELTQMDDDELDDKEASDKISSVSRLNLLAESESSDDETPGLNFRSEKVDKKLEIENSKVAKIAEKEGMESLQEKSDETESKKKKKKKREEVKLVEKEDLKNLQESLHEKSGSESQDTEIEGKKKKKKKKKKKPESTEDIPIPPSDQEVPKESDEGRQSPSQEYLQSQNSVDKAEDEDEELDKKEATEQIQCIRRLDLLADSESSNDDEGGFYVRVRSSSMNSEKDVSNSGDKEEEKKKSKEKKKKKKKTTEDSPVKNSDVEKKKEKKKEKKDQSEPEISQEELEIKEEEEMAVTNDEDDKNVNEDTINRLNTICRLNLAYESDSDSENEQTFSADTAYRVRKIKNDAINVEEEDESSKEMEKDEKLQLKSEVQITALKKTPTKSEVSNKVVEKKRKLEKKKNEKELSRKKDETTNDPDWSVASDETEDDDLDTSRKKRINLLVPKEKDNLTAAKRSIHDLNISLLSNGTLSKSKTEQDFEGTPVTNLSDLIKTEKLVEEKRDCTFSLNDLVSDEELYVFTLPTKILGQNLKGTKFNVSRNVLSIGSEKYRVQQKHPREVACMTQVADEKGNKKYKTVRIRPSGKVTVLQQVKPTARSSGSSKNSSRSSSVMSRASIRKPTKRKMKTEGDTLRTKKKKVDENKSASNNRSDFSE